MQENITIKYLFVFPQQLGSLLVATLHTNILFYFLEHNTELFLLTYNSSTSTS
jgi:hypothetical protein